MIALLLAVPFVFSVSPSSAPAGAAGAEVTVAGRGFTPRSVGLWNGKERRTLYVSSGELRVELRPSDLVAAEPGFVSVYDRVSRAASAGARFQITAPNAPPAVYEPERASREKPARPGRVPGKTSL